MQQLYLASSLIGTFAVAFALSSHFIKERLYLSEAMVATLFGVIMGPRVLGILHWTDYEPLFLFTK